MGAFGKQYEQLACPFCERGIINCIYIPGAVSMKRAVTASLPGKGTFHKSRDVWIVQSGCNACGKSKEEVEKELRKNEVI